MQNIEISGRLADLVAARPMSFSGISFRIHDDEPDITEDDYGLAEGQTFVIRYVGSSGEESVRPITVFSIEAGAGGAPVLKARCHVRKTTRAFRVDRISECIDYDGEIHTDIAAFMVANFGMHPALAQLVVDETSARRWSSLLAAVRPVAILLASVMRADGEVVRDEIGECLDCLSAIAERQGVEPTKIDMIALRRYLLRLRPGEHGILNALDEVASLGPDHSRRVLSACARVMDADGERRSEEVLLISAIAKGILGVGLSI